MTRIIGIDPGSKITGYGIIDVNGSKIKHIECGGIHVPQKKKLNHKLLYIHDNLIELIRKFEPDEAGVEDVFVAKNAKSSLMLGHVRGAILLTFTKENIACFEYRPTEIKKAVTGVGRATKEQIQFMVKSILRLREAAFEDASDALGAAICHSQMIKLQNRLRKL